MSLWIENAQDVFFATWGLSKFIDVIRYYFWFRKRDWTVDCKVHQNRKRDCSENVLSQNKPSLLILSLASRGRRQAWFQGDGPGTAVYG
jgi:hypothetical protein